jgi:phosphohistidine phosphatase
MDLYTLRHAIAEDRSELPGSPDSERRLTRDGERKMRRAAAGMKAAEMEFDLILSSPYIRAKQTADILADVLKLHKVLEISPELTPGGNPRKLIDTLNGTYVRRESVVLVGHEPYLSSLVSLLLSGDTGLAINLKKGALCKLETDRLKYGRCATLQWLLTSRQMRLMKMRERPDHP